MSPLLVAAAIAVATPVALLSLAYLAAASAYRRQALQDEEAARLWNRPPVRHRPIAAAVAIPSPPRTPRPVHAAWSAAKPRPSRHVKKRAAR
jgi:hypothetical protein